MPRDEKQLNLTFVPFDNNTDFDEYERLVSNEMAEGDYCTADELAECVASGEIQAWYAFDGPERVGWCAVRTPSREHIFSTAVHLLGMVVFGDSKGRGYGRKMLDWRMHQFGDVPFTSCVRPDHAVMEHLLSKRGFKRGFKELPWYVWHRPAPVWSNPLPDGGGKPGEHRTLVLIEHHPDPDPSNFFELECLIERLEAANCWVEITQGEPPRAGHTKDGLWPDPAAFNLRLTLNSTLSRSPDLPELLYEKAAYATIITPDDLTHSEIETWIDTYDNVIPRAHGKLFEIDGRYEILYPAKTRRDKPLSDTMVAESRRLTFTPILEHAIRGGIVFVRQARTEPPLELSSLNDYEIVHCWSGRKPADHVKPDAVARARREMQNIATSFAAIGIVPQRSPFGARTSADDPKRSDSE